MAVLSKAAFITTYADVLGAFKNNTTRDITEATLRQFAQDLADSTFFQPGAPTLEEVLDVSDNAYGHTITDLADPVNAQDVATKAYVDSTVAIADGTFMTTVTISSADVLALYNVPKVLVTAAGAGQAIIPVHIITSIDYNSAAYATSTGVKVGYNYGGTGRDIAQVLNFLSVTQDSMAILDFNAAIISGDLSFLGNKALEITTTTASNPTAGNSPMKVVVVYKILAV